MINDCKVTNIVVNKIASDKFILSKLMLFFL